MNTYKVSTSGGSVELTIQADRFEVDTEVNILRFYTSDQNKDEDEEVASFYFSTGSYVKKVIS